MENARVLYPSMVYGSGVGPRLDVDQQTKTVHLQIDIPPIEVLTPAERAQRQRAIDRILARCKERGPIGIPADELKHRARSEAEA